MLDVTDQYTLALALEDFVPVVLSIVALLLIASWARVERPAAGNAIRIGAYLVGVGGLSKATWKLLVVGGTEVPFLEALLFPAIGVGFAFVVTGLRLRSRAAAVAAPLTAPLVVGGIAGLAALALALTSGGDTWTLPFLVLSVLGSTAAALQLSTAARRDGERPAAVLFLLYLVAMFAMAGLARAPEQTLRLQWIEQSISTAAQATFLVASWRLRAAAVLRLPARSVAVATRTPDPA